MKQIDLSKFESEELLKIVEELQFKLNKVNHDLFNTRQKLMNARVRIRKMKDTVQFQRKRILELYR